MDAVMRKVIRDSVEIPLKKELRLGTAAEWMEMLRKRYSQTEAFKNLRVVKKVRPSPEKKKLCVVPRAAEKAVEESDQDEKLLNIADEKNLEVVKEKTGWSSEDNEMPEMPAVIAEAVAAVVLRAPAETAESEESSDIPDEILVEACVKEACLEGREAYLEGGEVCSEGGEACSEDQSPRGLFGRIRSLLERREDVGRIVDA